MQHSRSPGYLLAGALFLAVLALAVQFCRSTLQVGPHPTPVTATPTGPRATREVHIQPTGTPTAANSLRATQEVPEHPTNTPTAAQSPRPTREVRKHPTETPTALAQTPTPSVRPRSGRTFYVDSVHGSDQNPGDRPDAPWATLARLNNMSLKPGDIVNLARGSTWTGSPGVPALTIHGTGGSNNPIAIQPYGSGAAPVLRNPSGKDDSAVMVRAPWVIIDGLMVREAHKAGIDLAAGADHTVVRNTEATLVGSGILVWSQHNLITGNYVHDTTGVVDDPAGSYGADGVLLHASNNEVSYNRFVNCKVPSQAYGTDGGAVEFFGTVDNISIHHNYAYNCDGFDEVGGGSARHVVVAFNLILFSGPAVGLHLTGPFASVVDDFQFVNNTVVDTVGAFSLFYVEGTLDSPEGFVVRNNIFYLTGYTEVMQGNSPFTHDHNLYFFGESQPKLNFQLADGERIADPLFIDPENGDYRLQASSPAIGAGVGPAVQALDFLGTPLRSSAVVNMGAFRESSQTQP